MNKGHWGLIKLNIYIDIINNLCKVQSLRVVHGSLFLHPTRPGEMLTRPDRTRPEITDKKSDPIRPPCVLCFMSSTFRLPTENNIQLLHDFEGHIGKYFSSGLENVSRG